MRTILTIVLWFIVLVLLPWPIAAVWILARVFIGGRCSVKRGRKGSRR